MNTQQGYLLVVEDVPDILILLHETLKFKGYRVVTARNGMEALEAIEKESPALIITDILMPEQEGIETIRTIEIVGLDLQADGGTHVANTREVGGIRVTGYESKGRINKRIRIELTDPKASADTAKPEA